MSMVCRNILFITGIECLSNQFTALVFILGHLKKGWNLQFGNNLFNYGVKRKEEKKSVTSAPRLP